MKLNVLNVGLMLLLGAVAALQSVQLHETRTQLEALSASLQHLNVRTTGDDAAPVTNVAPITSLTASRPEPQAMTVTALETRIAELEKFRHVHVGSTALSQQEQQQHQAQQLADNLIASGYLDDQQWQTVAADVEAMDKASNKAFWEKMFAAIESGDLTVYGADMQQ